VQGAAAPSDACYIPGNPAWTGSPRLVIRSGGGTSALLAEMAARGYATSPNRAARCSG
jgi:hypothetical protein